MQVELFALLLLPLLVILLLPHPLPRISLMEKESPETTTTKGSFHSQQVSFSLTMTYSSQKSFSTLTSNLFILTGRLVAPDRESDDDFVNPSSTSALHDLGIIYEKFDKRLREKGVDEEMLEIDM